MAVNPLTVGEAGLAPKPASPIGGPTQVLSTSPGAWGLPRAWLGYVPFILKRFPNRRNETGFMMANVSFHVVYILVTWEMLSRETAFLLWGALGAGPAQGPAGWGFSGAVPIAF